MGQVRGTRIEVKDEKIVSNREATRWLGVWLGCQLKFKSYINERVRRALAAEIHILKV